MLETNNINLKKNDIIFSEGEINKDLFLINKGKVLAFVTRRTEVTPVSYFEAGDFIGELSFFDKYPRIQYCALNIKLGVFISVRYWGDYFSLNPTS